MSVRNVPVVLRVDGEPQIERLVLRLPLDGGRLQSPLELQQLPSRPAVLGAQSEVVYTWEPRGELDLVASVDPAQLFFPPENPQINVPPRLQVGPVRPLSQGLVQVCLQVARKARHRPRDGAYEGEVIAPINGRVVAARLTMVFNGGVDHRRPRPRMPHHVPVRGMRGAPSLQA